MRSEAERGILFNGEPPLPWCAGRQIALPDTWQLNTRQIRQIRCFGIAGNFGKSAKAGFGIYIYGNSSGPFRMRGLRGRPSASLAADLHGETGTVAAAKP